MAVLSDGVPVYRSDLTEEEREYLAPAFLITTKKILVVVNIGEDQLDRADEIAAPFASVDGSGEGEALAVCLQLEAEAAQLDPEERAEMLEGLGLGEGVVPRVARGIPPARSAYVPDHRRAGGARGPSAPAPRHRSARA